MKLLNRHILKHPESGMELKCITLKAKTGIFAVSLELGLITPVVKTEKQAMNDLTELVVLHMIFAAKEIRNGRQMAMTPADKKYWDIYIQRGGIEHLMSHSHPVVPKKISMHEIDGIKNKFGRHCRAVVKI